MIWDLLLMFVLQHAAIVPGATTVGDATLATEIAVPVVDSIEIVGFGEQRTNFGVRFGDAVSRYRVMGMFVLPGETVAIEIDPTGGSAPGSEAPRMQSTGGVFALAANAGRSTPSGANRWLWTAPVVPGIYPIEISNPATHGRMTLNVFVMVPYSEARRGRLNGYRIGRYPLARAGHESAYAPPRGFIEVTPENVNVAVSPHFSLGQFMCKQAGGYPKYVVLRQPLLVKLEGLLALANQRGHRASTFQIMSAYRTPFYNAAIGNRTSYSRHHYGDAADIFIDEFPADGRMDDLNRDGRHTVADARVLGKLIDETVDSHKSDNLSGGLGTYGSTHGHGPFVHVDVRGFDANWES
ncbi:MAG TPA: hypothetical protein VEY91_13055 [Candidatus Limnocylindria bacterium]|nr:hypothetical protein [Candidatus Limnocylindria bacterium]